MLAVPILALINFAALCHAQTKGSTSILLPSAVPDIEYGVDLRLALDRSGKALLIDSGSGMAVAVDARGRRTNEGSTWANALAESRRIESAALIASESVLSQPSLGTSIEITLNDDGSAALTGDLANFVVMPTSGFRIVGCLLLGTLNTELFLLREEIPVGRVAAQLHVSILRVAKDGEVRGRKFVPLFSKTPSDLPVVAIPYLAVDTLGNLFSAHVDLKRNAASPQFVGNILEIPLESERDVVLMAAAAQEVEFTQRSCSSNKITRQEVVARARQYAEIEWQLSPNNRKMDFGDGSCRPEEKLFWQLPTRLKGIVAGTIRGMPYKWYGLDTIESFQVGISDGKLPGNICTKGEHPDLVKNLSVGVDCSGLVSRVWGFPEGTKKSTRELRGLVDVIDTTELKPGDALLSSTHIMLFMNEFAKNGTTAWEVVESSNSECEGVCTRVIPPGTLSAYTAVRNPCVID